MTVEHDQWCANYLNAINKQIRAVITSAITDLERLNEVLSAGIADQVRVREIIEKLRKVVEP